MLAAWLADGGISWNRWQSGLAAIRRRYESDPGATPEGVSYSKWSLKLWSELSEKVLGPDWKVKLKEGRVLPRLPQSGAPSVDAAPSVSGLATGSMLATTAKAKGTPVPPASLKREIWGLLERGGKALSDSDARRDARLEARSAPDVMRRTPMPEFSIFTPRVPPRTIAGVESGATRGATSPTPSQLGPGCAVTSELYSFLETNDLDVDEVSAVAIDRLNAMDIDLQNMGYSKGRTGALIQLEWFIRDLIARWRKEVAVTGQRSSLAEWSLRQMMTTDFTKFDEFGLLELQISGLGRLAGLSYAEATAHIE